MSSVFQHLPDEDIFSITASNIRAGLTMKVSELSLAFLPIKGKTRAFIIEAHPFKRVPTYQGRQPKRNRFGILGITQRLHRAIALARSLKLIPDTTKPIRLWRLCILNTGGSEFGRYKARHRNGRIEVRVPGNVGWQIVDVVGKKKFDTRRHSERIEFNLGLKHRCPARW